MFPKDFISWDDCEDDEDDFVAFRDHRQGVQEVISACYVALGDRVFNFLSSKLDSFGDNSSRWEILEAILLMCSTIIPHLKSKDLRLTHESNLFLKRLFSIYLYTTRVSSPILAETACRCLQASTFLITSQKPHLTEFQEYFWPALHLCLNAMAIPLSCTTAVKAMHQLTVHGSKILLRDGNSTLNMIHASTALLASLPPEAALMTVESTTRISVQMSPEDAKVALWATLNPLLNALSSELQTLTPSPQLVARLLDYCAQMIRFCDTVSSDVLQPLLTAVWPLVKLAETNATTKLNEEVIECIFKFYRCSLNSALSLVISEVDTIGQSITNVIGNGFVGQRHALNCASTLLEVLKGNSSDEALHFLIRFIEVITQLFLRHLQGGSYDADALESYFSFVYSAQLHSAHALSASPVALDTIPRLCITCLQVCKERVVLRNVLQVLQAAVAPPYAGAQVFHAPIYDATIRHANRIIEVLIQCLAGEVTSANRQNVIDTIVLLLSSSTDPVFVSSSINWVGSAIESLSIPQLNSETQSFVVQAIFRLIRSNPRLLKALLQDFSKVCCSELQPDCLLAYE